MTTSRLNLRNVATIVACLAVTTMFASCDETNGDDDGGGGNGGGAKKTVEVSAQIGTMTAGVAGTVTYSVTTDNISNGNYDATVDNRPAGVTVQGKVTINSGSGTLTLAGSTSTKVGETKNLTLTIDKTKSAVFALNITEGRTLTAEEKKLLVAWGSVRGVASGYVFSHSTPESYVYKWQQGGAVFSVYVYNDDGTGHFAYSSSVSGSYGWTTWNWRVEGNKIHYSKNVGNNWVNGVQVAKDKKFDDDFVYFKVTVNDKGEPVLRTLKPETVASFKPGETIDNVLSDPYAWYYYSEYDKLE